MKQKFKVGDYVKIYCGSHDANDLRLWVVVKVISCELRGNLFGRGNCFWYTTERRIHGKVGTFFDREANIASMTQDEIMMYLLES